MDSIKKKRSGLFLCAEYIVTDVVYLHMLDKFLASVEEGPNNVVVQQDGNSPCSHIAVWLALYWIKIEFPQHRISTDSPIALTYTIRFFFL